MKKMRITSTGNVGIRHKYSGAKTSRGRESFSLNQTNALIFDQSYTVHGNVSVTLDRRRIQSPRPRYEGYYGHRFITWAGEVMRIQQNGNVGIGVIPGIQLNLQTRCQRQHQRNGQHHRHGKYSPPNIRTSPNGCLHLNNSPPAQS